MSGEGTILFINQAQVGTYPWLTCTMWPTASAATQQPCTFLSGIWSGVGSGVTTLALTKAVTVTGSMNLFCGISIQNGATATFVNSVSPPLVAWTKITGCYTAGNYATEWWMLSLTASVTNMQVALTLSSAQNVGFSIVGLITGSTVGTKIATPTFTGATATLTWPTTTSGSQLLAAVFANQGSTPTLSGCAYIYNINSIVSQVSGTSLADGGSDTYKLYTPSGGWCWTGIEVKGPVA